MKTFLLLTALLISLSGLAATPRAGDDIVYEANSGKYGLFSGKVVNVYGNLATKDCQIKATVASLGEVVAPCDQFGFEMKNQISPNQSTLCYADMGHGYYPTLIYLGRIERSFYSLSGRGFYSLIPSASLKYNHSQRSEADFAQETLPAQLLIRDGQCAAEIGSALIGRRVFQSSPLTGDFEEVKFYATSGVMVGTFHLNDWLFSKSPIREVALLVAVSGDRSLGGNAALVPLSGIQASIPSSLLNKDAYDKKKRQTGIVKAVYERGVVELSQTKDAGGVSWFTTPDQILLSQ